MKLARTVSPCPSIWKRQRILGTEIKNLYGPGYITDKIGNIEYRISPLSFYQVNPVQTERLYGTALEFADLNGGETVWDLLWNRNYLFFPRPESRKSLVVSRSSAATRMRGKMRSATALTM
ncbi:MAG: hypothetical protein ACLUD2_21675 [Clostridium sp.]